MSREQLRALARRTPESLVQRAPKGGGQDYISHATITELLLYYLGPFDQRIEEIRGGYPAIETRSGKKPGAMDGIVGAKVAITVTIDGRETTIEEVGVCENAAMRENDADRYKHAVSDGLKRCAMRLGLGLELWSQEHYRLDALLGRRTPRQEVEEPEAGGDGPPSGAEPEERLSLARAQSLRNELEKLGIPRGEQDTLAAAVLGRRVRDLTELSDAEALALWNVAKRGAEAPA